MQLSFSSSSLRVLAIDPVDPRNVFVGGDGVYGTSDAGLTWKQLSSAVLGAYITSLAVHPTVSGELFALDEDGRIFLGLEHGLSWRPVLGVPRINMASFLTVDPGGQSLLVGSSSEGVFTLSPLNPRTLPAVRFVPFRP
jgi:photosystem II stability/assembly factor-like uncharacterized protein